MFVQVIEGKVRDAELLSRQGDAWMTDLAPGAAGFLGSTNGVTADGVGLTIARFESEDAARANSGRAEQGAWWDQTAAAYDGDVSFSDSSDVDTVLFGDPDEAGFVQVIRGRVNDQEAFRKMATDHRDELHAARPDILGITLAWHGAGEFTQVVYFGGEEETRQREAATEGDEMRNEFLSQFAEPPHFYDLVEPDLY
jgi:hypothetical protein